MFAKRIIIVVVALSACFPALSSHQDIDIDNEGIERNLRLMATGRRFIETIEYAQPIFDSLCRYGNIRNRGDREALLWTSTFLAQAWLFLENYENTGKYLDFYYSNFADNSNINTAVVANSTEALMALKHELNYSKAVHYFQTALSIARKSQDDILQVPILCNIAAVYYRRKDTTGREYAEEAYRIVKKENNVSYLPPVSLSMANMDIIAGRYEDALKRLCSVEDMIPKDMENSGRCLLLLIYGDVYCGLGRYEEADSVYALIAEADPVMEPSMELEYLYKYGLLKMQTGEYSAAGRLFSSGLALSYEVGNIENRHLFLSGLSDYYSATGDESESYRYYKRYGRLMDSLSLVTKERDFNQQLMTYARMDYEREIHKREIRNILAVFIIVLIMVILAAVYLMYRRRNAMYVKLVGQYRKSRTQIGELEDRLKECMSASEAEPSADDRIKELFLNIERLMNEERVYRMPNMSLDMLAEMSHSNRLYVSRAINSFSNMNFSAYLNGKRISEAISRLSDPDDNTPLKVLWEDLGFGSISVFYKVFCKETGCSPNKYREIVRNTGRQQGPFSK